MEKRTLKRTLYAQIGQTVKALANEHRLEILELLANSPKSVESIARETHLSVANASQHLQVLRTANLVGSERKGNFIYYQLARPEVYQVLQNLRNLSMDHSAEIKAVLTQYRKIMGSEDFVQVKEVQASSSQYILLDVRSREEYNFNHIPGAVSIPIAELEERLAELPSGKLIAVYCRGPFCTYSDEAVQFLHQKGFSAIRLESTAMEHLQQHSSSNGKQ